MCGMGMGEMLVILLIVVIIFGATRLPQLGKALGETVKNFKKGAAEARSAMEDRPESIDVQKPKKLEEGEAKKPDSDIKA
jgi:sec-independent protein translocase protein TatA